MNVTIEGASHIGAQFAVHCAKKWQNIILHTWLKTEENHQNADDN